VDDYYDIAELQEEELRPRDPAIDDAIKRLLTFFEASPQRLFYSTQIETSLEREYSSVADAVEGAGLGAEGRRGGVI
jgi:hypothetical protein